MSVERDGYEASKRTFLAVRPRLLSDGPYPRRDELHRTSVDLVAGETYARVVEVPMAQPQARPEATVEDLYRVEGKAEIVGGEIVLMAPAGFRHGRVAFAIASSLREYERTAGRGFALPDNVGFIVNLPNRRSFCPDAAYFVGEPSGPKFLEGAPIFAVEVRSDEDYGPAAEKRLAAKRADYFAAGTRVVWDVDFMREGLIRSYSAAQPEAPRVFGLGEVADAEPALPGWRVSADTILEPRRG